MAEWLKQTADQPLFGDLLWSRPENKQAAGKLLIIGGNRHGFASVSSAYQAATKAGIGSARAVLPDALAASLGKVFPEADFAPSNPSGSFGSDALASLVEAAGWADDVLLTGDFGKNSETAILLEKFTQKYEGPLVLAGDSIDYFSASPQQITSRPGTAIVARLDQLQKLLAKQVLLTSSMDLHQLVENLAKVNGQTLLLTYSANQFIVSLKDRVSTTKTGGHDMIDAATFAAVWLTQQPTRPFEAASTAMFCLNQL